MGRAHNTSTKACSDQLPYPPHIATRLHMELAMQQTVCAQSTQQTVCALLPQQTVRAQSPQQTVRAHLPSRTVRSVTRNRRSPTQSNRDRPSGSCSNSRIRSKVPTEANPAWSSVPTHMPNRFWPDSTQRLIISLYLQQHHRAVLATTRRSHGLTHRS